MNFLKAIILAVLGIGLVFLLRHSKQEGQFISSQPLERPSPSTFQSSQPIIKTPVYSKESQPSVHKKPEIPLEEKVYIGSVNFYGYPQEISCITIRNNLKKGESVDITNWKIKSNKGEIIIPRAIEVYTSTGQSELKDIVLKPGEYLSIFSNTTSFNKNFRLNKCFGYLQKKYNFYPQVSLNCPYLHDEEIKNFSGKCQDYIYSLSSCEIPSPDELNKFANNPKEEECLQFLRKINYQSCFGKHRRDADFLSNEWRVYIGKNIFDRRHDYVRIYSEKGKLIDEYKY